MQAPKTIPPIKLKHSAKLIIGKNHIIQEIVEHYKSIPQYQELKNDVETIEHITKCVLDMMSSKSTSDPKIIIIQILIQLFAISQDESIVAEKIIDYFIQNKIAVIPKKSTKVLRYITKQAKRLIPN
jgi:hypothetical protein